jgi:uncharacterized membrane protein
VPAFWIVLGVLLTISSILNARAALIADDLGTQVFRAVLSLILLTGAFLSARKGLAEMDRWPPKDMSTTGRRPPRSN